MVNNISLNKNKGDQKVVYFKPEELRLISEACKLVGLSFSPFLRTSALQNAQLILRGQTD